MNPRLRWLGGAALAVGLWSAWIVYNPNGPAGAEPGRRARTAPRSAPPAVVRSEAHIEAHELAHALPVRNPVAIAALRNPFEARPWVVRREVPTVVAVVAPPVVESVAPPAEPPLRLPYRFIGIYAEKTDSPKVFLMLGDRLIMARSGETIEGGFRLDAVSARELTFVHVQQNVTLRMGVDGGSL